MGFEDEDPYAIPVVQLAEDPRMMTSLTGVPSTPRPPAALTKAHTRPGR